MTYKINGNYKPATKRIADLKGPDFYPTPVWATHALLECENFKGDIWECACGNGVMSEVLKTRGNTVISTDLHDRGYGETGIDFLKETRTVKNIVTNPPYNVAQKFVERGLESVEHKMALLLRLAFLEGGRRAKTIFSDSPPSRVWVFSERVTFYQPGVKVEGPGTTAYAWFVWDKTAVAGTKLDWILPGLRDAHSG